MKKTEKLFGEKFNRLTENESPQTQGYMFNQATNKVTTKATLTWLTFDVEPDIEITEDAPRGVKGGSKSNIKNN